MTGVTEIGAVRFAREVEIERTTDIVGRVTLMCPALNIHVRGRSTEEAESMLAGAIARTRCDHGLVASVD